ncbi:hypothetical protein BCAR13_100180 [Paraburkholderia caribensis]|nr:hypothetical protein BCAR13_100180 [Paraburkholderia caribensis]
MKLSYILLRQCADNPPARTACFDLFAPQHGERTGARKPVLFLAAYKEMTMSTLHSRPQRAIVDILRSSSRRARRVLHAEVVAVLRAVRRMSSRLRKR